MKRIATAACAAAAFWTTAALAQQEGLVNVQISDISILHNVGVAANVQDLVDPVTVQVPIGIAAQVCPDVDANVLARQEDRSSFECNLTSGAQTTQAFNNLVQRNQSSIEQQIGDVAAADDVDDEAVGATE